MKKLILGGAFLFTVLVLPLSQAQASNLTNTQIQAILDILSSFGADSNTIANVNIALTGGSSPSSSSATFCHNFSRDLGIGLLMSRSDAQALDTALLNQGIPGDDFVSFDEDVAARVVRFQSKQGMAFARPATWGRRPARD